MGTAADQIQHHYADNIVMSKLVVEVADSGLREG